MEYVKAQPVWMSFMERAITYNFEEIFHDMIYILHFITMSGIQGSQSPAPVIEEAKKNEGMMLKVRKVLWDGIQRFLDYTIELKEKQPEMFADVLSDYDLSSRFMKSSRKNPSDDPISFLHLAANASQFGKS